MNENKRVEKRVNKSVGNKIVITLCAIAVIIILVYSKQPQAKYVEVQPEPVATPTIIPSSSPLLWPSEKITKSIENIKCFVEARLSYIADNLGPSGSILTGKLSTKEYLKDFLASKELDRAVDVIHKGQKAALVGPPISLILIPDIHSDVMSQAEESKQRQAQIEKYVKRVKPALVFIEGVEGEINWQTTYSDLVKEAGKLGTDPPASIDEFKTYVRTQASDLAWWQPFLDQPALKLFGFDRTLINRVVLILFSLDDSLVPMEAYENTSQWLNFDFREPLILANIVLKMRSIKATKAYIAIGEMHAGTLPHYYKDWHVKVEVANLKK